MFFSFFFSTEAEKDFEPQGGNVWYQALDLCWGLSELPPSPPGSFSMTANSPTNGEAQPSPESTSRARIVMWILQANFYETGHWRTFGEYQRHLRHRRSWRFRYLQDAVIWRSDLYLGLFENVWDWDTPIYGHSTLGNLGKGYIWMNHDIFWGAWQHNISILDTLLIFPLKETGSMGRLSRRIDDCFQHFACIFAIVYEMVFMKNPWDGSTSSQKAWTSPRSTLDVGPEVCWDGGVVQHRRLGGLFGCWGGDSQDGREAWQFVVDFLLAKAFDLWQFSYGTWPICIRDVLGHGTPRGAVLLSLLQWFGGGVRGWVSRGVGVLLAYIDDFRL